MKIFNDFEKKLNYRKIHNVEADKDLYNYLIDHDLAPNIFFSINRKNNPDSRWKYLGIS